MFTIELICYDPAGHYSHFLECQDVRATRKSAGLVVIETWRDKESVGEQTYLAHYRVAEHLYNRAIIRNSQGAEIQVINTHEITEEQERAHRKELGLKCRNCGPREGCSNCDPQPCCTTEGLT